MLNLFGQSLEPLLTVEQNLTFGDDFKLTLDLADWVPSPGDTWRLFSAASFTNFDAAKFAITSLNPLPAYQLLTSWDNAGYQVSFQFNPSYEVSEPAGAAIFILGLLGLATLRRRLD